MLFRKRSTYTYLSIFFCLPLMCCGHEAQKNQTASGANGRIAARYTVHEDHVDPKKTSTFIGARHQWLRTLAQSGKHDDRGTFLQVDSSIFYTLHAISSYADIDTLRKARREMMKTMSDTAIALYDSLSDYNLIPPHTSEIWTHEEDLDYISPDSSLTLENFGEAQVVIETISPTPSHERKYLDAWNEVKNALIKAKYPVSRICYFSGYGKGEYISFWLTEPNRTLAHMPKFDVVAGSVLGKSRIEKLLSEMESSIAKREKHTAILRPDMSDHADQTH